MKLDIGYGTGTQALEIDEKNLQTVLYANKMDNKAAEDEMIEYAMAHPIGTDKLKRIAVGKKRVVIITSDITRPMPSYKVMPRLLAELQEAGVALENITVVFALGSHRAHTEAEHRKLVGDETYDKVRCIDSSQCQCIHMGETKEGTPVDIAEVVANADLKICVGNIEYHFFAGYSGGAKAIMPGVSNRQAIRMNHRKLISSMSGPGILEGNPVREDLEEAALLCGVDFILNVVLDEHKHIVYAVAGDMIRAHREGCRFLDGFYRKPITKLADIVVVSQGGAPKDLNLYQTQKALANAEHAVRPGGIIILTGACPEGSGEAVFERWMLEAEHPDQILERLHRDFQIGGHKAAAFARALKRADIYLVSDMEEELVKQMFMHPYRQLQTAYDAAFKKMGADARVIVMPYGGSTLPVLVE